MGFLDELKKLARPYDEDEDDYMDDAEVVDSSQMSIDQVVAELKAIIRKKAGK